MLRPTYFPARPTRNRLRPWSQKGALLLSAATNIVLVLVLTLRNTKDITSVPSAVNHLIEHELSFNGGHPLGRQTGTCVCGPDKYCLCSPSLAIDLVMATEKDDEVWVVRRKDTGQLAVMGGFVQVGESVEQAVARELTEETGLTLTQTPVLLGVYSDPRRDNRRHTVSAVFVVTLSDDAKPVAADDVKAVQKIKLSEAEQYDFFADHKTILMDYRQWAAGHEPTKSTESDFASDIERSVCYPTKI